MRPTGSKDAGAWVRSRIVAAAHELTGKIPEQHLGDAAISVVTHWAIETAIGAAEFNSNLGYIHAYAGQRFYDSTDAGRPTRFASYASLADGAHAYVSLVQAHYLAAWNELAANPTSSAWYVTLGRLGYFEGHHSDAGPIFDRWRRQIVALAGPKGGELLVHPQPRGSMTIHATPPKTIGGTYGLTPGGVAYAKQRHLDPSKLTHAQVLDANRKGADATAAQKRAAKQERDHAINVRDRLKLAEAAQKLRPDPKGDPAAQSDWLGHCGELARAADGFRDLQTSVHVLVGMVAREVKVTGLPLPMIAYPEFGWVRTGNGLEAIACVHVSDGDVRTWNVGPDGSWGWHRVQTSGGVDLGHLANEAIGAFTDAVNAAGGALESASHTISQPFAALVDLADQGLTAALDEAAKAVPPQFAGAVKALKGPLDWIAATAKVVVDPAKLVKAIPWSYVADGLEAITSNVPILGTAVSDVVATVQVLTEALRYLKNPLQLALHAAYDYLMASVPDLASLRPILDPVVDVIIRVADGEPPTAALIDGVLDQIDTKPSIGGYTPRSIAASLMAVVVQHKGLAQVAGETAKQLAS
jgi:hypothetical protein